MNNVHNYYWRCPCEALMSDTIPACMACKKARPTFDARCEALWVDKPDPGTHGIHLAGWSHVFACKCQKAFRGTLKL